jgi:hypothetical protein
MEQGTKQLWVREINHTIRMDASCPLKPASHHSSSRRIPRLHPVALSRSDAVEKHANANRRLFCRAQCEITRHRIESLKGESSKSVIKEFLLPKGEGQDEGEPRPITEPCVILARNERPSSTTWFRLSCRGGQFSLATPNPPPTAAANRRRRSKTHVFAQIQTTSSHINREGTAPISHRFPLSTINHHLSTSIQPTSSFPQIKFTVVF